MSITPDSLMSLERYAKYRKDNKPNILAHRRLRTVQLGDHVGVQFEDEQTVRHQIQEMLRLERIFEEGDIQGEIEAYLPLVPDGSNWKATLLIEHTDMNERRQALEQMLGLEERVFVEVEGQPRIYAIANDDWDGGGSHAGSAVHFLRFEFPPAARTAVLAGAGVTLGCDHEQYPAQVAIKAETLASLARDLTG